MQLTPGTILGDYEILDPLGKGGMGEVHRARDRKLGREVALKVLPHTLAQQVNRRLRFEREARILASLNHPNIASIYGLHEVEGVLFLVMELASGEVLSDRLKRKPLPLRQAMLVAREIAAALEYAHGHSVIHRDLKPANVAVSDDDNVKVLDFGLAKALKSSPDQSDELEAEAPGSAPAAEKPEPITQEFDTNRSIPFEGATHEVRTAPFDTIPADQPFNARAPEASERAVTPEPGFQDAVTRAGAVVGTPLYMSPEQARGKELDYRTDIWAFGCLFYEMLCGVNSFQGESVAKIVARILEEDPDWERLPPDTPRGVIRLLRRCLNKDLTMRLQHIGDARIELTEILNEPQLPEGAPEAAVGGRRVNGARLTLFILGVLAGAAISVIATWSGKRDIPELPNPKVLGMSLAPPVSWPGIRDLSMAISPDGRKVAYIAREENTTGIRLRPLDELGGKPLAGTEGATALCFSPDGAFVAFAAHGELKKIELVSEAVTTIVRGYERITAPTWPTPEGLMFTPLPARGICTVNANGGEVQVVTTLDSAAGEQFHGWAELIPGTSIVLFTVWPGGEEARPWIEALDFRAQGQRRKLIEAGQLAHYDPIDGALIYANNGTLFVQPLDVRTMRISAGRSAVPILRGVATHPATGLVQYDVARDGSIVYMSGTAPATSYRLLAFDDATTGTAQARVIDSAATELGSPRIAPDGSRIALTRAGLNTDIWLLQNDGKNPLRLTSEPGYDGMPLWSPDGRELLFSSVAGSSPTLMAMRADGIGTPRTLLVSARKVQAESWSADGRALALSLHDPQRRSDIYVKTTSGSAELAFAAAPSQPLTEALLPFRVTDRDERAARISPSGRWIVYQQDGGRGDFDVYVQPYGHEATLMRVTEDGGSFPAWGRETAQGRELYYLAAQGMMRVIFDENSGRITREAVLIKAGNFSSGFDVNAQTGEIVAVEKSETEQAAPELNMLLDWRTRLDKTPLDDITIDSNRTTGTSR